MNSALIMQANLLLSLVVCGLAQYATGITAFLWLPFLLAITTLLLLPLQTRYGPLRLDYQEKVLLSLYCGLLLLWLRSLRFRRSVWLAVTLPLGTRCVLAGCFRWAHVCRGRFTC